MGARPDAGVNLPAPLLGLREAPHVPAGGHAIGDEHLGDVVGVHMGVAVEQARHQKFPRTVLDRHIGDVDVGCNFVDFPICHKQVHVVQNLVIFHGNQVGVAQDIQI